MTKECFAYYRVSTNRQGVSGLGLEAQQKSTRDFALRNGWNLLGEFTEIESGKQNERPQLQAALQACQKGRATLLIAKLDRLARNVHFIAGLLEADVQFLAVDMPNADRFILHVYAALAEEEARRISERTKQALRAAKARGVELGRNGKQLAIENAKKADAFSRNVGKQIESLRTNQRMTYRDIAIQLNEDGVKSARSGVWHASTVHAAYRRFLRLEYNSLHIEGSVL